MPRFQYAGLELISLFRLSKRLGPSPVSQVRLIFEYVGTINKIP